MGENTKNPLGAYTTPQILLIFREISTLKVPDFLSGNVAGKSGWSERAGA